MMGDNERRVKVKPKILASVAMTFVLLMALSQTASAYVYPDPPKRENPGALHFSPWMIAVAVAVTVAVGGVAYLVRSRKAN